jgi:hypothetical protein
MEVTMQRFSIIAALVFAFASTAALADKPNKPSDAEIAKIKAALAQIGCEGGDYDKEASGIFEVDDATCKIGTYDFKLDKDFNIILMSRD